MKTIRLVSVLALMLAVGGVATSCKKVNDADVQTAVQAVLALNPDFSGVSVSVMDQVATLSGTVKDETSKSLADSTVAAVEHVKSVVNNIEVVPPAPDFTAVDSLLNTGLADLFKSKGFEAVKAEVKEGIVTLTGEIRKRDLLALLERVDSLKPNQVINNITVK